MQRSRVDLPLPEGPMTQTTSPVATERSMPRNTCSLPKCLCRSSTSIIGRPVPIVMAASAGSPRG